MKKVLKEQQSKWEVKIRIKENNDFPSVTDVCCYFTLIFKSVSPLSGKALMLR